MQTRLPFPAAYIGCTIGIVVITVLLGGCGGGSAYSVDPGTIAQRFLPTTRQIDHHPDSLRALSIEETDRQIQLSLDGTYESLHRKWSCTYRDLGPGRSRNGRSYATFWGLELSLASLQPELGITSLSKEPARKAIRERRREYQEVLQFDVYWFEAEGNSILAGPGVRVRLRVDGEETYRPSRDKYSPLREAFVPGETQTALYRRNTFYFSRVVDSTDILAGARRLELVVDQAGRGSRMRFSWEWPDEGTAHLRPTGSPRRLTELVLRSRTKAHPRTPGRVASTEGGRSDSVPLGPSQARSPRP